MLTADVNDEQTQTMIAEAASYAELYHKERARENQMTGRLETIGAEIGRAGTYRQTADELAYGVQVAWRNTPQCVGKFYWRQGLEVRDLRDLSSTDQVFEALVDHLRGATNGGKIRLLMSVFAPQQPGQPGLRIWNSQLVLYAGYRQPDGSVIGDPSNIALTEAALHLGWRGAAGTPFDLLPLVIQMPHQAPQLYEIPADAVLEVPISHPELPWFEQLGLKWYAHPAISNMRLDLGGLSYTAAPFSGWYTCAEVGARSFGDVSRYNLLPRIATLMGLNTRSDRSLWKDRALIELTAAVLHSYTAAGVTMIDHHYVGRQFVRHEEREAEAGRITPARYHLMIPPISSSASPLFQRSYQDVMLKPNFFAQPDPWTESPGGTTCPVHHARPDTIGVATCPVQHARPVELVA